MPSTTPGESPGDLIPSSRPDSRLCPRRSSRQLSLPPAVFFPRSHYLEIPFPFLLVTHQSIFRKQSTGHVLYDLSAGSGGGISSPGVLIS